MRLLTPRWGRLSALARGARGRTRRFGGALDHGNRVEAALRRGSGSLWHLDEASLTDARMGARKDLVRTGLLGYATELCAALAREDHEEPRLFGLLDMASVLLSAMTEPPGGAFRVGFEAKALTFAGIQPAFTRCAACDAPADEPMVFLPAQGGAQHLCCHPGEGTPVSLAWLHAVEQARRTPLRELIDAPLPPGPVDALAEAVEAQLGAALRSRRVLAALGELRTDRRPAGSEG